MLLQPFVGRVEACKRRYKVARNSEMSLQQLPSGSFILFFWFLVFLFKCFVIGSVKVVNEPHNAMSQANLRPVTTMRIALGRKLLTMSHAMQVPALQGHWLGRRADSPDPRHVTWRSESPRALLQCSCKTISCFV